MATYKVIQDIEAEDKLLGPLSLRQFIYAVICMGSLFMCYLLISRAGTVGLLFAPLFLVPAAFFGFLAFPFSKDQPTELWALARMNYYFRPRKRVWNQSAARELVTVTAPKRVERNYTNGLSQTEVRSRLSALAQTLDSRGWAVKNASQTYVDPLSTNPDRLIDAATVPQEVANEVYTDVYDPSQGTTAQHFDAMLRAGEEQKRAALMQQMQAPIATATEPPTPAPAAAPAGSPQDFWFMNQPAAAPAATSVPDDAVMFNSKVVNPGTDTNDNATSPGAVNEGELLNELKEQEAQKPKAYSHLPTIQPLDVQRKQAQERHQEFAREQAIAAEQNSLDAARLAAAAAYGAGTDDTPDPTQDNAVPVTDDQAQPTNPPKQVTPAHNADILNYVNNDDLDLATISRQLNRPHQNDDGSVEISLH